MPGLAVLNRRTPTPDGVLVQEAAAGSGVSYGALYDRYATQVFNYCLRLTGSAEDASDATQEAFVNVLRRLQDDDRPVLEFSAYLFAAARHESYGLMRQRARTRPTDSPPAERGRAVDVESDPERSVLLRDSQEAVRAANAQLAPRHREVLALREVAGQSYDEIGQTMGISENAAAQLIFRARSKLREALTAGAVASVVATSEECETAQVLLNMVQDGELVEEVDRIWLDEHLDECGSCKTANRMLLEVGASYRLWLPVALLAGMRADTLTRAGALVGADWSQVPAAGKGSAGSSGGGTGGISGATTAATATAVVIAATAIGGLAFLRDDDAAPVDPAAKDSAASVAKQAEKSRPKSQLGAKADIGGQFLAARGLGSLPGPALAAAPTDSQGPSSDTGPARSPNGEPGARLPQGGTSPSDEGRRPRSDEGPGPPPRRGPRSNPPAPPGPPGGRPVTPEPRAAIPAPADPVPPAKPVEPNPPSGSTEPPVAPTDPPVDPPVPPTAPDCTFPGRGTGPGQCPPGHGGERPGNGAPGRQP